MNRNEKITLIAATAVTVVSGTIFAVQIWRTKKADQKLNESTARIEKILDDDLNVPLA